MISRGGYVTRTCSNLNLWKISSCHHPCRLHNNDSNTQGSDIFVSTQSQLSTLLLCRPKVIINFSPRLFSSYLCLPPSPKSLVAHLLYKTRDLYLNLLRKRKYCVIAEVAVVFEWGSPSFLSRCAFIIKTAWVSISVSLFVSLLSWVLFMKSGHENASFLPFYCSLFFAFVMHKGRKIWIF